jgi:hypothetical protein
MFPVFYGMLQKEQLHQELKGILKKGQGKQGQGKQESNY